MEYGVLKFVGGFFWGVEMGIYHRVEPYDPSTSLLILHRTQNQEPSLSTEFSPIPNRGRPFCFEEFDCECELRFSPAPNFFEM